MNFLNGTLLNTNRVRLGNVEVEAVKPVSLLSPGSSVTVCCRPEDIEVADEGSLGDGANRMETRVAELDFLGSFFRARLAPDCLDGMILAADLPSTVVRQRQLSQGGPLTITLPSDRLRVYPAAS